MLSWHVGSVLTAFARVAPHAAVSLYLALMPQQPGVVLIRALAAASERYPLYTPPGDCTAYSAVNSGTTGTGLIDNGALQVLEMGGITGAGGKITTLTVLLAAQAPVPAVPARLVPQSAAITYRAVMVWHPGVAGMVGDPV